MTGHDREEAIANSLWRCRRELMDMMEDTEAARYALGQNIAESHPEIFMAMDTYMDALTAGMLAMSTKLARIAEVVCALDVWSTDEMLNCTGDYEGGQFYE